MNRPAVKAAGGVDGLTIERLTGVDAASVVEPLLREYVPWVAEQVAELGVTFDDTAAVVEQHQALFRAELPNLVGPHRRLLVARRTARLTARRTVRRTAAGPGEVVGLGALRPVDATTAEIKRMYVRPAGRGRGVGRALLERLLVDARSEGYSVARLETLAFMTAAQGLYRSLGFRDIAMFDDSETALSGLEAFTHYLELDLSSPAA